MRDETIKCVPILTVGVRVHRLRVAIDGGARVSICDEEGAVHGGEGLAVAEQLIGWQYNIWSSL